MADRAVPAREGVGRPAGFPVLPAAAVPAGLRIGAAFAAVFGTLWLVQGIAPWGGPLALAGILPGLATAVLLYRTRHTTPPRPTDAGTRSAERFVTRATLLQIGVSLVGAFLVQVLLGAELILPFIVLTVGLLLLALYLPFRRPHLLVAGAVLTVLPLLTGPLLDGADRAVTTGLVGGAVLLAKGALDLVLARRP